MKILLVTHRYPPRTGGVETHVKEIATRLADRGHDVTVFSADAGKDVPARGTNDGVRVRRFRSLSPGESFYFAPQLALAVRRADADVIHAHNYHAFPLFFAALGVADEQFGVTTHYHGESADKIRNELLSGYRPFGRWAVRQADEVIAVSEWERDQLAADFSLETTVIPNGVDAERFVDAAPVERDRPYLLTVGRLEAYKGIQHVIRALVELPEYDLLVAGDGSQRMELEEVARRAGVADRVEFLGYVDDNDLPELYAGATAYLTLSEFEAYGITVAEALAAGTPCIVRKAGALVNWVNQPGCVGVNSITPDAVATAVKHACGQQPTSAKITGWDTVVDRLTKVYQT